MAENKIFPIIKEFNGKVDFNIYFIAEENEEEKKTENDVASQFKSLHGEKEVIENIRQVIIGKYYRDKLGDYILERNKKLKDGWEESARKVGIDPEKIERIANSEEGASLFIDNIKKSQELNIKASPTIMINSVKFPNSVIYDKDTRGNICQQ